ncbi:MAG TPA: pteridine-dependent deoxygenase [Candidatus Saccharimonadia bacterium]|nr:pteridine-dependent deoxygenase [Candidatus Saccharimonadia bacterium]
MPGRKPLRTSYVAPFDIAAPLPEDTLAYLQFGADAPAHPDARAFTVALQPIGDAPTCEWWRGSGAVTSGRSGEVRYAHDGEHLFGRLELDEHAHGGIEPAADRGYRRMLEFTRDCGFPHLVRIWNYFDAINSGSGDDERYRRFCVGRAAALAAEYPPERLPAATAIGRPGRRATLQLYWIATRASGVAVENPRQESAYRYPRRYGPAAPSFSRAMTLDGRILLVSGTASVVGHATNHAGDVLAQLDETLANLTSLCEAAARSNAQIPTALTPASLLKVYVRDPADDAAVRTALTSRLPPGCTPLYLRGDICRADLLLEIDAVHVAPGD